MRFTVALFKDGDCAKLLSGQALSQLCDKMMTLGMVWVISTRHSASWVPWFLAVGALPHLVLALSAGAWASRFGPLRTLVWTDAARGVLFLAAAVLWRGGGPSHALFALLCLTFYANLASALFNPAILSLPVRLPRKDLVPQLTAAIDSCFSLSSVLGPVFAAVLYPWLGLSGLFAVNGLSYLLAAVLEAGIRVDPAVAEASADPASPPLSPGALLLGDRLLLFMLSAFFLMNLFMTPIAAFLPLFARQLLHGEIATFAWLETAVGVGAVAGGLALTVVDLPLKTGLRSIAGLAVVSGAYLAFCLSHEVWAACAALAVFGLALSVVNISLLTLFQTRPLPKDVPVLMSLVNLVGVGALPFSMALLGGVVGHMDLRRLATGLAIGLGLVTLATAFHKGLRAA
jgi:MFS family permease